MKPNISCIIVINNLVFDLQHISNSIVNILYYLSNKHDFILIVLLIRCQGTHLFPLILFFIYYLLDLMVSIID